jgi:hypothetical protein
MNTIVKTLGALVIAGTVAAGGSAFTAGGLGNTVPTAFIGGSVTQTVSGASLDGVKYTPAALNPNQISTVDLTFNNSVVGQDVVVSFDAGGEASCTVAVDGLSASCGSLTQANNFTTLHVTVRDAA